MRDDLDRVIITRPRSGTKRGRGSYRKARHHKRDFEDLPTKEKMKGRYGYDLKEQTDYLTPLQGWLRKQVDRPWNDVWSDLCRRYPQRNYITNHVLFHAEMEVQKPTFYGEDGGIYHISDFMVGGGPVRVDIPHPWKRFYVDPEGILRMAPVRKKAKRRRNRNDSNVLCFQDGRQFHCIDGVWYDVGDGSWDKMTGRFHHKRTLNRKELRTFGLENDPQ